MSEVNRFTIIRRSVLVVGRDLAKAPGPPVMTKTRRLALLAKHGGAHHEHQG
jgi:hypothetical protein